MKCFATNSRRLGVIIFVLTLIARTAAYSQGTPNVVWQQQQNSDRINSVVFSPDGQSLISGSSDRLINFWRLSDGALTQVLNTNALKVHESSVEWLAINNDGSRLASCSYKMVKLWRLPAGTEQQLSGHSDWVVGVAFSPGGTYLASASFDGTVKIWRGSDGGLVKTINIGSGEVRTVSFSPNGQYLASGGGDGAIRIWQTSDWSLVQTLTGHTSDIYVMTFSPDGATLASGGYDHTARLWNTATWTLRSTINAAGNVYALAFTRDSQQLAVSDGEANHIELHRTSTGALIKRFDQQVNNVQSIAFSQGGLMGYGRSDATVVLSNPGSTSSTPPPSPPPPTTPPPAKTNPPVSSVTLNIIWQHASGVLNRWLMMGTNHVGTFKVHNGRSPGGGWRVFGLGDFDRDAKTDFVFQNASGATALWLMDGDDLSASLPLTDGTKRDPRWRVAGVADFNGDGQEDILFQTANGLVRTWLMHGTEVAEVQPLLDGARLDRGWRVVAIGDFNRDGNSDLVVANAAGNIEIQLMNDVSILGTSPLDLPQAKGWRVAGAADFNGDGQTDLLLQSASGYIAVWFLNGGHLTKASYLNDGKKITPGWRVVGVTR